MIDTRTLQGPATVSVTRSRRIKLAIVAIVLATGAGVGTWQAATHAASAPARTAVVQTNQELSSFQQLKGEGHPDSASARRLASFQQLKDGK